METVVTKLQELLAEYGLRVVGAILIVVIGRWVAIAIKKIIAKLMEKSKVEQTLVSFVTSLVYMAMMAFIIIAALNRLGIQTASFVAVLAAAGLAIGLALQGSLANFAAGVLMIIFKPFKVGDAIDAAGTFGIVEEISIFTTQLKTPDNKVIIVPNAKLTSDNITNFSAKDQRRVDLVAGVSYSDDLDKVKKVLEDILAADERVLEDPAATIAVSELGESSVNFVVRPWVNSADYWDVYFGVTTAIKKRFDEEGISIPFPQRDVHIIKENE